MRELNFHPFPEIETERILLRQLSEDDAGELYFLRSDPEVLKYIGREPAKSVKATAEFIGQINADIDENIVILWGMALKDNPYKIIGTVCIWHIMKEHSRGELGYVLHPGFWKKGLMKEALTAVVNYAFDKLEFHSLEADVHPGNVASVALLESMGFVKEAHFKENVCLLGKFEDTLIFSLLESNRTQSH